MNDTINDKLSPEDDESVDKPAVRRSFSDVLRHHGFKYGNHFQYSWMQLWRRGNLQYCEVSPAMGSNSFGEARIVGAGLGEKSFDDPEALDKFLSYV